MGELLWKGEDRKYKNFEKKSQGSLEQQRLIRLSYDDSFLLLLRKVSLFPSENYSQTNEEAKKILFILLNFNLQKNFNNLLLNWLTHVG